MLLVPVKVWVETSKAAGRYPMVGFHVVYGVEEVKLHL